MWFALFSTNLICKLHGQATEVPAGCVDEWCEEEIDVRWMTN